MDKKSNDWPGIMLKSYRRSKEEAIAERLS